MPKSPCRLSLGESAGELTCLEKVGDDEEGKNSTVDEGLDTSIGLIVDHYSGIEVLSDFLIGSCKASNHLGRWLIGGGSSELIVLCDLLFLLSGHGRSGLLDM